MNAFTQGLRRSLASRKARPFGRVTSCAAVAAVTSAALVVVVINNNNAYQDSATTLGRSPVLCEEHTQEQKVLRGGSETSSKLIFLGSGSSTGCPVGECLFSLPPKHYLGGGKALRSKQQESSLSSLSCRVSHLAGQGNPKFNKNYRNNPSLLIHHYHEGTYKNIIVDVGKTFREGALRWFPEFQIQSLDAIILTHEHMDAAAGLDDIRSFQQKHPPSEASVATGMPPTRKPVPLFLSQPCHDSLSRQFPFLLPPHQRNATNAPPSSRSCCQGSTDEWPNVPVTTTSPPSSPSGTPPIVHRDVAGFQVHFFQPFQPITVEGVLEVIPLPVWHGEDLISYGFAFSIKREDGTSVNVVYISDISRLPKETLDFIQTSLPPTDILVVDALLWHTKHPTHYSLDQAVELKEQIQPRMGTYLVGMSCEAYPPHEEMEQHLKSTYGDVTMAYDGLCITV